MKKNTVNLLSILGLLFFTGSVYAGHLWQHSWYFEKGETITEDYRNRVEGQGKELGCYQFNPVGVSFDITYSDPQDKKFGIEVHADNSAKVKHDTVNHRFTVTNAKTLEISLPGRGLYQITNTTGHAINGTNCDAGIY